MAVIYFSWKTAVFNYLIGYYFIVFIVLLDYSEFTNNVSWDPYHQAWQIVIRMKQ